MKASYTLARAAYSTESAVARAERLAKLKHSARLGKTFLVKWLGGRTGIYNFYPPENWDMRGFSYFIDFFSL